jgi:hypothetical protein
MMTDRPYAERRWLKDLPEAGCHRVILADLVGRFFLERGVAVRLFEVDPTFCACHARSF